MSSQLRFKFEHMRSSWNQVSAIREITLCLSRTILSGTRIRHQWLIHISSALRSLVSCESLKAITGQWDPEPVSESVLQHVRPSASCPVGPNSTWGQLCVYAANSQKTSSLLLDLFSLMEAENLSPPLSSIKQHLWLFFPAWSSGFLKKNFFYFFIFFALKGLIERCSAITQEN